MPSGQLPRLDLQQQLGYATDIHGSLQAGSEEVINSARVLGSIRRAVREEKGMKLNIIVTTVLALKSPTKKVCYHGGHEAVEYNPSNFPACWAQEASGVFGCYNPIGWSCDGIRPGIFDIRLPKYAKLRAPVCPPLQYCRHGGIGGRNETNPKKFPQCWFKEVDSKWGCYKPINGSCLINGRRMVDLTKLSKACSMKRGERLAKKYRKRH